MWGGVRDESVRGMSSWWWGGRRLRRLSRCGGGDSHKGGGCYGPPVQSANVYTRPRPIPSHGSPAVAPGQLLHPPAPYPQQWQPARPSPPTCAPTSAPSPSTPLRSDTCGGRAPSLAVSNSHALTTELKRP